MTSSRLTAEVEDIALDSAIAIVPAIVLESCCVASVVEVTDDFDEESLNDSTVETVLMCTMVEEIG
jgi:hypothetical protein